VSQLGPIPTPRKSVHGGDHQVSSRAGWKKESTPLGPALYRDPK